MEIRVVAVATIAFLMGVSMEEAKGQDEDYSDPIKCFYCFGLAENSSCADPVDPKVDKDKSLQVIECESGICLKWTHYYQSQLYMHRTCSHRLTDFKIMMISGVCRSERKGNGNLCMCGKNLCNAANTNTNIETLDPIKCFYCFGLAENSSCADPVDPKVDKDKSLQVIECESGICLKWTHYYQSQLYMHRTCSHRLPDFKIMMISGVCRSELKGNGNLCMCSKNLCNAAKTNTSNRCLLLLLLLAVWRRIYQANIDLPV